MDSSTSDFFPKVSFLLAACCLTAQDLGNSRVLGEWGLNFCESPSDAQRSVFQAWGRGTVLLTDTNVRTDSFLFFRFYLFIFRKRGGEGEREGEREGENIIQRTSFPSSLRETSIGSVAYHTRPEHGLVLHPRHVPWPGLEPATFHCAGWCLVNWAMVQWLTVLSHRSGQDRFLRHLEFPILSLVLFLFFQLAFTS